MTSLRFFLWIALLAIVGGAGAQTAPTKTYIVQLSAAPAATYDGGVDGLAATRPAPGDKIDASAPNVRAYMSYLDSRRSAALAVVGSAAVVHTYDVAFAGFAAQLTDEQAAAIKLSSDVVAVVESQILHLVTTNTPQFLGISAPGGIWSRLDGSLRPVKGDDVIIGMIDSGIWPEDASFGDKLDTASKPVPYNQPGVMLDYGPPPAKWKGTCQTGPGFSTAMCNNKLLGARFYSAGFDANPLAIRTSFEYLSPRDGAGHGSHTSSTAGGNANVDANINGAFSGVMSGIAPRARLATYKVCWEATVTTETGCYNADVLKAIDDAVKDGVDVINYSISGTQTTINDPIEIAFLNASAANVFVAAAAGNDGPANAVAHITPWLTTVAASTHDRNLIATVTLGNGATFSGPSYQRTGLPFTPMILAQDAGLTPFATLSPTDQAALQRCYNAADRASLGGSDAAALDPTKVAGKLVVCIRGGNVLINKGDAVKLAGGVAMIIQNTPATANTLILQPYVIPTVHLDAAASGPVLAYAATPGAVASFSAAVQVPGVIAPVMATFSSRGPNKANADILKPDISGPGVDVVAAYIDTSLTQEQHDGVAAGTFTPKGNANSLQGTSMSTPHIAGSAALLRQLYPKWSPAAIKSALMTTTTDIKLASGAVDPDRWGYGAGHMNPNGAADPGLVYDAGTADYGRFLCGLGLTPPAGIGGCSTLGSILAQNLNLASLTASAVPGTTTLTRTITNVSTARATYDASASLAGWNVVVAPARLILDPGASASFGVTLVRTSAALNAWTFGSLTWSDGTHTVRSPLSARAIGFASPTQVTDTRASGTGTKVFSVVSAYTGAMTVVPTGLVPATETANLIGSNARQCYNFTVPAGALTVRFQLFNADTQGGGSGTDLDLDVFNGPNGTGTNVGSSGGSTSNEVVTLSNPPAGTYSACVTGFATPAGGATYKLSSWIVGPAVGPQTLRAAGPSSVYAGGSASIGLGWTVPAGKRYLGNVRFFDNTNALIGATVVFVDNH